MGPRRRLIARELFAWALRRRRAYRVTGRSMTPTLGEGDLVLVEPRAPERVGQLIVLTDPRLPTRHLVKRTGGFGQGTVSVLSDSPTEGTDSRHFGSVPLAQVLGVVTLTWRRTGAFVVVTDD